MLLVRSRRSPRRGVMLILSTMVITFVGLTGVLGLWALSSNAAVLVKMTGLAASAAYAGASAVDLNATSSAQEWVVINEGEARNLARQAFNAGRPTGSVQADDLRDDQILVYNIATAERTAEGDDPTCQTGINGNDTIKAPEPGQKCWLAVAYLAAQPGLTGITPTRSRPCMVGSNTLLCSMHYTSGVAVTVGYQVTQPCGGGTNLSIPFCQPFRAIATGYADYTARDG